MTAREQAKAAIEEALGHGYSSLDNFLNALIDAVEPIIVREMWKTGTPQQVREVIEAEVRADEREKALDWRVGWEVRQIIEAEVRERIAQGIEVAKRQERERIAAAIEQAALFWQVYLDSNPTEIERQLAWARVDAMKGCERIARGGDDE